VRFLKNSTVFASTSALQKSIGFLLLPLYSARLDPREYGVYGMLVSILSLASILTGLQLPGALTKYYWEFADAPEKRDRLVSTISVFVLGSSLVVGALATLVALLFRTRFQHSIPLFPHCVLVIITLVAAPIFSCYQTYLSSTEQARRFGVQSMIAFLLSTGTAVVSILVFDLGLVGLLLGGTVSSVVLLPVAVASLWRKHGRIFDRWTLRLVLRYAAPLIPHSLFGWLYLMCDRLVLASLAGTEQVGYFHVATQIAGGLGLLTDGFNKAYAPWFMRRMGALDTSTITRVQSSSATAFLVLGCLLGLVGPELVAVFLAPRYAGAARVLPLLFFAQALKVIYFLAVAVLFLRSTKYIPYITFIGAVTSVTLNFALVPILGYVGPGLAAVAAQLLAGTAAIILSARVDARFFPWRSVAMVVAACSIVVLGSVFASQVTPRDQAIRAGLAILVVLIWLARGGVHSLKWWREL
jgi:O-antigen/teichoic acid export membrane protein